MSAFALSRSHIDAILTYAKFQGWPTRQLDQLGQNLLTENTRSLAARYGESDEMALYSFEEAKNYYFVLMSSFLKIKDLEQQVLKLIDCADYQCCEHDGWFDSTSYNFLCSLRDQIQSKQFSNTQDKQSTVYDSLYWEWNLSDAHCAVVEYPNGDRALIFEEKTYEEHLKEHQARLVAYYGNLSQAQGAKKYPRIILLLFLLEHQTPSTIARAVSLINQYRQDKILGQNNCQLLNELKHCRQRLQETKKRF